jgi:hypothetical protein
MLLFQRYGDRLAFNQDADFVIDLYCIIDFLTLLSNCVCSEFWNYF